MKTKAKSLPHTFAALAGGLMLQLLPGPVLAQNSVVTEFGDGGFGTGWQSDDTRNSSGTSINNATTHAPGTSAISDPAAVDAQINWTNFYGSRGNLGGVSLTGTNAGGGKSTISIIDTSTGLAAASELNNPNFRAAYRWQNTDTVDAGPSLKFGIQSTAFGTGTDQSQNGFTATRSGEASWDLLLVYDPTQPGNSGNSTIDGAIITSVIDPNASQFFLFGQAGNNAFWDADGSPSGGAIPPGFASKTLAGWAADPVWGPLLFGSGATVANTQLGFGSGNQDASGIVDSLSVSFLNNGDIIQFADASAWTGPTTGTHDFTNAANWTDSSGPSASQNVVFDTPSTSFTAAVSANTDARSVGVINGDVTLDVANGQILTLNNDGFLSAEVGSTLNLTGDGSTTAAAVEAWGTVNVASELNLDGGSVNQPVRNGRYAVVVGPDGELNLQDGADVTVVQDGQNPGVRIGEGAGNATMNIADGASLTVGSTTQRGFLHVGDWSSDGTVNQTGGTVQLYGAANIGHQGGNGEYNISGGSLTVGGGAMPDGNTNILTVGRTTDAAARPTTGTMNISGDALVEFTEGNADTYFYVGGNDATNTAGSVGVVNQTGGTVRIGSGVTYGFGYGEGTYNLDGGVFEVSGGSTHSNFNPSGSEFNLGGGTFRVIDSDLTTSLVPTLVNATVSTIDTNGFDATFSGTLSGSGTLAKAGDGDLNLSGNNSMTGQVYVVDGGINQTAGTSTINYLAVGSGSGANGTFGMSGGSLDVTQALQVGDFSGEGVLNQTGGSITVGEAGPGSLNISNQGGNGEYNLSGGSVSIKNGFANLGRSTQEAVAGDGVLNISGSGLFVVGVAGDLIIGDRDGSGLQGNGVVNQTGGILRIEDTGELWIGSHGQGTYNLNGGVLEVGGGALRANYQVATGGSSFNLGGGTVRVTGSALTSSVQFASTAATTSTLDTNGFSNTLSGGLTGAGTIAVNGGGSLELTGASTGFTGELDVVEASLILNSALGSSSSVVVQDGSLLGGSGSAGAVTLQDGGTLAPGNSIGTLSAESLTWEGGVFEFELSGTTNNSDLLALSGSFTKNSAGFLIFDFLSTGPDTYTSPVVYTLVTFGDTNFSVGDFGYTNLGAGLSGDFAFNGNSLTLTVVPEPRVMGLILVAGVVALLVRRRARKARVGMV